jgi:hypothetical protein
MCKCVQLPASAQRGTKKKSVDGVVAERRGRGRRKRRLFLYSKMGARCGAGVRAKELPLSIQPYRASLATTALPSPVSPTSFVLIFTFTIFSKSLKFCIAASISTLKFLNEYVITSQCQQEANHSALPCTYATSYTMLLGYSLSFAFTRFSK